MSKLRQRRIEQYLGTNEQTPEFGMQRFAVDFFFLLTLRQIAVRICLVRSARPKTRCEAAVSRWSPAVGVCVSCCLLRHTFGAWPGKDNKNGMQRKLNTRALTISQSAKLSVGHQGHEKHRSIRFTFTCLPVFASVLLPSHHHHRRPPQNAQDTFSQTQRWSRASSTTRSSRPSRQASRRKPLCTSWHGDMASHLSPRCPRWWPPSSHTSLSSLAVANS